MSKPLSTPIRRLVVAGAGIITIATLWLGVGQGQLMIPAFVAGYGVMLFVNRQLSPHVPRQSGTGWISAVLILATLLGSVAVPLAVKIREGLWDKVFSLPERATAILAADIAAVYLGTQDGSVYHCSRSGGWSCSRILLAAGELSDLSSKWPSCGTRDIPPAPGNVISLRSTCKNPAPDATVFTFYALLDDGSVWTWSMSRGGLIDMSGFARTLQQVLGAVIGFLIGRVIVLAVKFFKARRQPVQHI